MSNGRFYDFIANPSTNNADFVYATIRGLEEMSAIIAQGSVRLAANLLNIVYALENSPPQISSALNQLLKIK